MPRVEVFCTKIYSKKTNCANKSNLTRAIELPYNKQISFKGEPDKTSFYDEDELIITPSSHEFENRSINKLIFKKPNFWQDIFNDQDVVIKDSKIGSLKAYRDKDYEIKLLGKNNIGLVEGANELFIVNDTNVNNITKTTFTHIYGKGASDLYNIVDNEEGSPHCKDIESLYTGIDGTFKDIKSIKSNHIYLRNAEGYINNIQSNYLEVKPEEGFLKNRQKNVIINDVTISDQLLLDYSTFHKIDNDYKNGYAELDNVDINNLKCKTLYAENSNLKVVDAETCEQIKNTSIESLSTSNLSKLENSTIENLKIKSNEFVLNSDQTSKINKITFLHKPGILTIKNNESYLPKQKVDNGIIRYELENYKTKNFVADEKTDEIILSGNSEIDNIEFSKYGKVILKNDKNGIHPNISKIKVKNAEIIIDYPTKGFDNVAGMEELKQQLREDVIEPLTNAKEYKEYGLDSLNGFLLYGPPGCGKTFITRMLAEETGRYFVELPSSSVGSKYQHETVKNIAQKFKEAIEHAPSVIFLDEVEAMVPARESLAEWDIETNEQVTELLQQINNCKDKDVLVVCASNEPQKIDNAIKRTGRMDKKIFLGPPDVSTRKELFKRTLSKIEKKEVEIDYTKLAESSEYYTAEDIRMVVRAAAVNCMKLKRKISTQSLVDALSAVKPSLNKSMIQQYKTKGEI